MAKEHHKCKILAASFLIFFFGIPMSLFNEYDSILCSRLIMVNWLEWVRLLLLLSLKVSSGSSLHWSTFWLEFNAVISNLELIFVPELFSRSRQLHNASCCLDFILFSLELVKLAYFHVYVSKYASCLPKSKNCRMDLLILLCQSCKIVPINMLNWHLFGTTLEFDHAR